MSISKKMLIDAAHPKEVRVVITNKGAIEEFDYQTDFKKSTKGNIYLAKVTRVEHSLQAVFVDYGAGRNGFLSFSEVHPDYYQIPVSDREKLIEEMEKMRQEQVARSERSAAPPKANNIPEDSNIAAIGDSIEELSETKVEEPAVVAVAAPVVPYDNEEDFEKPQFYKRYKIQEVIKKDQVLLVQVEKEERGNKGAALTTYISLAGRYCVLMPNATKGGGVSRKIDDEQDRERLKKVAKELTLELEGQGAVIVRTAGAYKTKAEIKRDCAYLQKLWDNIRKNIIKSNAPTFIHEEGDVIKKSIRDLYDNDMEEIIVAGEEAFDNASNFMKLLLPKHINKLKLYKGKVPLFIAEGVEEKLAAFYENKVLLNSGGYLIINQTEALVAIDVNSGKATLERNIEDTAYKTNISAAYRLAEHAKIRDLSGLIVIDFIDMESSKNQRAVEKALRDAFSHDKARVQIGKMSPFGLIEMTRQRLRQGYLEANTKTCDHCQGRGKIRSLEATSIVVLRAIENEIALAHDNEEIHVSGTSALMFHIMNKNRHELARLEQQYPNKITFYADESAGGDGFFIEKKKTVRDYNDIKALSGIIDHTTEAEKGNNTGNNSEQNHKFKSRRKMRFKKNNYVKKDNAVHNHPETRQNDIPIKISEQPQSSENKFKDYDSPRNFKRKNYRKSQEKVYREKEAPDELNEHNFDKEMAERRKDNQSLLKEIWKKIVD